MSDDNSGEGDEFIVEKIEEKRIRNGKVGKFLSFWVGKYKWSLFLFSGRILFKMEKLSQKFQYMGACGKPRLPGIDRSLWRST